MSDVDGPGDIQPKDGRDEPPEIDIDAAFAAIIADFAAPTPHGVGPWPASEDLDDEPSAPTRRTNPAAEEPPAPAEEPPLPPLPPPPPVERHPGPIRRIILSDADTDPLDEPDLHDEDRYIPPEPPPFPRGDLISRLAWGAVIGGPAFLLIAALLWRTLPAVLLLTALLAFVAGFVTLVVRMPADHPDDGDDGAVV